MPFTEDNDLNNFFYEKLKPSLEEHDYICERADNSTDRNLDRPIVEGIYNADIIIADLTLQNSNVFYELGIAHTIPKPTFLIAQSLDNLPFDVKKYKVTKYETKKFDTKSFFIELDKVLGASESNLVTDYKPPIEAQVLKDFALKGLTKSHKNNKHKKLLFIDLDGTLFDSYEHRIRTSQKAFQNIFEGKSVSDLKKIYEKIYSEHEKYVKITGKNFRYDWRTKDIYIVAYLNEMVKQVALTKDTEQWQYLRCYLDHVDAKTYTKIEEAHDIFIREPFHPFPCALQMLESLKLLGFHLILVTEGEKKVQEWKLEQLGMDTFFDDKRIGIPYENLQKLKEHIDTKKRKVEDHEYINALNVIFNGYVKIHDDYKNNFHSTTIQEMLNKHGYFQLAVIGDRYDVDLQPYERIKSKKILRLAITMNKRYTESTIESINDLKKSNPSIVPPQIVPDLYKALEILIDPDSWEKLEIIKTVPQIPSKTWSKKELSSIRKARALLSKADDELFVHYADDILRYEHKKHNKNTL